MSPQRVFEIAYAVYDAILMLDPKANGWAEAIDQACVDFEDNEHTYAYGIWFHVHKQTPDLNDYEALGSWIVSVMSVLDTIPRDQYTIGAQPTNVIFTFFADNAESLEIRVSIEKYWTQADGISGEEVFRMFYTEPQSPTATQSP